jgi:hypothetical protein
MNHLQSTPEQRLLQFAISEAYFEFYKQRYMHYTKNQDMLKLGEYISEINSKDHCTASCLTTYSAFAGMLIHISLAKVFAEFSGWAKGYYKFYCTTGHFQGDYLTNAGIRGGQLETQFLVSTMQTALVHLMQPKPMSVTHRDDTDDFCYRYDKNRTVPSTSYRQASLCADDLLFSVINHLGITESTSFFFDFATTIRESQ